MYYFWLNCRFGVVYGFDASPLTVKSSSRRIPFNHQCCNSLEECQEPVVPELDGFAAAGLIVAAVSGALVTVWIVLRHLAKRGRVRSSFSSAIKAAGDDSVYCFVLAKSKSGWLIALFTVFIQVMVFGLFLQASDFANDDGEICWSLTCDERDRHIFCCR